jgi:hypothetical protein
LITANKADRGKGVECDGGTRRGTREHNNALKGRGKLRQRDNTELIAKETKKRVNPPIFKRSGKPRHVTKSGAFLYIDSVYKKSHKPFITLARIQSYLSETAAGTHFENRLSFTSSVS